MSQLKEFWIVPAIMAGAVLLIFAALFYDKMSSRADSNGSSSEPGE